MVKPKFRWSSLDQTFSSNKKVVYRIGDKGFERTDIVPKYDMNNSYPKAPYYNVDQYSMCCN